MSSTDSTEPDEPGPHDPPVVVGSLSPSRAADFLTCPLLYRFRTIDRLPSRPSAAASRGTVVHGVLERLYDLPASERTLQAAVGLVQPSWQHLRAAEPLVDELFGDEEEVAAWLAGAQELLVSYFALEDPTRLEPAAREQLVEVVLPGGLRLRGVVDRVDRSAAGELRVVDYKTGRAPGEQYESKALFQMRFYALVLWRTRGVVPRLLQLLYLGDREVLRYSPDEADLLATERKLLALWAAIERATAEREFLPRPSRLCGWCDHQALCPAFGGTPPAFPATLPAPDAPLPHQQEALQAAIAAGSVVASGSGTGSPVTAGTRSRR